MGDANQLQEVPLTAFERWVSLGEFTFGAAVVVGHNVFHVVPNEVPILFVLGVLSIAIRNRTFRYPGLAWPSSWLGTLMWAVAAAILIQLSTDFVADPIGLYLWGPPKEIEEFNAIKGNASLALTYLGLVWTFAAVGEEVSYRAYLLNRAADALGRSTPAFVAALIATSVLFGIGHWYQGPAGVLGTGIHGFILGATYLLSGRNLWTAILAHGLIDTFNIGLLYFGLGS
jgi:CAAX protease family protein